MKKILREFEKLAAEHPIILKKRGAACLCRSTTIYILAHAGGGRVVAFDVKRHPSFSEHYVIYLGKNRVFDPTFAQVGGGVRRPVVSLADYPKNFSVRGVYDWREDFISCDLDEVLVTLPEILKSRSTEERSDRNFYLGCAFLSFFAVAVPLSARLLTGGL